MSFFITAFNSSINKDDYFEVKNADEEGEIVEAFVVTGYDTISTKGVEYISVDPQYVRDHTPAPEYKEGDNKDEFYWLNGGDIDGK